MAAVINALLTWWRQPPARQRILDALSQTEWRRGLDVIRASNVSVGRFYVLVTEMENDGLVQSTWEDGPPDPRLGARRRLYRKPGA